MTAATLLLDDCRPASIPVQAVVPQPTIVAEPRTSRQWARLLPLAAALAAVATAVVLAIELRNVDFGATLSRTDPTWVATAVGLFGLSILSAAYNLIGFSALRLRLAPTLLAQLAVGGLRIVTPSALSTPAIATRYLVRSGASTPDALATVGAAQTAQLLATMLVVGALAGLSGSGQLSMPNATGLLIGAGVLIAVAVAATRRPRSSGYPRHAGRSGEPHRVAAQPAVHPDGWPLASPRPRCSPSPTCWHSRPACTPSAAHGSLVALCARLPGRIRGPAR